MNAATHQHQTGTKSKHKQIKQQRQKWLLIGFGIAATGIAVLMLIFSTGSAGTPVPDFTASTLSGETVRLTNYKGQVVMLNFWATWCPPCKAEMPTIQAAYKYYHEQGFTVLAINNREQSTQIQPFANALALTFPIVLDTDSALQDTFAIKGYPTSLFISDAGEVYATHTGMLTPQQLDGYITTGLAKMKSKPA